MNARVVVFISALTTVAALALPSAQSAKPAYLTPPQVIADIMDAPPLPGVQLSPDRSTMLLSYRTSMPTIAEVTAPWIGLAGARVNPRNNGARVMGATTGLVLKDVETGTERKLAIPAGGNLSGSFSPDGRKLAITQTTDSTIRLLVADVATGQSHNGPERRHQRARRRVHMARELDRVLLPPHPGGQGLRAAEAAGADRPEHPGEQRPTSRPAVRFRTCCPAPTTSSCSTTTTPRSWHGSRSMATKTNIGAAGVYQGASRSYDDKYLDRYALEAARTPIVLPSFQFPRDVELWDRTGKLVRKLADVPMSDTVPTNGVFDGPRVVHVPPGPSPTRCSGPRRSTREIPRSRCRSATASSC